MEFFAQIFDFILHVDKHMVEIVKQYGLWTYMILFFIIFAETGFVVTPFLPGDSLLFAIGALSVSSLNFSLSITLLIVAAILGNTVNYFIGRFIGKKILEKNIPIISKIIKKDYIEKTNTFFDKHGGKAIVLSRFIPIIRTFAPFVAGIGKMSFVKFSIYNVLGGAFWVAIFMILGYSFGNMPIVEENFSLIVIGIIAVSFLPAVFPWIKGLVTKTKKAPSVNS